MTEKVQQVNVFFDKDRQKFQLLSNFLNCYQEKMQLNLKSEEQQDFLSLDKLKSQPVTQEDDIKIDYGIYQKVKDLGRGQSKKKINQNEMRILSSNDEKKRKQPLSKGEQYRERMDQY